MEKTQTLKSNEPKSVLSSPAYDLMVVAKLYSFFETQCVYVSN